MSADPTRLTHPLLFGVVEQHVTYYRDAAEYVSKSHIFSDLQKDSQFQAILEEAGIQPAHPNALRTFRRVLWPVIRNAYMNNRTGWWARTYGKNAQFFHENWATPEDGRDALNLRIRDREKDQASMNRLCALTEKKCGQLGWAFDAQYAEDGTLAHVDVWKYAA